MKYEVLLFCALWYLKKILRLACAISGSEDYTVLTEGNGGGKTVSVYGVKGWEGDLPNLLEERYDHGCASYMKGGKQVLIVAGGTGNSLNGLASTEILTMGAEAWTTGTPRAGYYPASWHLG